MKRSHYHDRMAKRIPKTTIVSLGSTDPEPWLRKALARCTKSDLIDMLVETASDDRTVLRRLTSRFKIQPPPAELLAQTRQAIADATAFDERDINRNFRHDREAYGQVQRNLHRLTELGQLRSAMELSLELMHEGSYQVEMSDEGLMTDDLEACFGVVLTALRKCDLPTADVIAWCTEMLKRDRVGFICTEELRLLRRQFEARPPA